MEYTHIRSGLFGENDQLNRRQRDMAEMVDTYDGPPDFHVYLTRDGYDDIRLEACGFDDIMFAHGFAIKGCR